MWKQTRWKFSNFKPNSQNGVSVWQYRGINWALERKVKIINLDRRFQHLEREQTNLYLLARHFTARHPSLRKTISCSHKYRLRSIYSRSTCWCFSGWTRRRRKNTPTSPFLLTVLGKNYSFFLKVRQKTNHYISHFCSPCWPEVERIFILDRYVGSKAKQIRPLGGWALCGAESITAWKHAPRAHLTGGGGWGSRERGEDASQTGHKLESLGFPLGSRRKSSMCSDRSTVLYFKHFITPETALWF